MARTGYLKRLLHRVRTKSNKMSIQSGDIFEHGDVSTSKNSFVEPQDFDPDGNVFHLMVSLTLMFMVLYVFGASVPYWYIMREPVNNITSCESAELYVTNMAEQLTHVTKDTQISVSSSLWFLRIQIGDRGSTKISRMFPFISLPHISLPARALISPTPTRGLLSMITFTLLGLGAILAFKVSLKLSGQIYYGLSSLLITTGVTAWLSTAIPRSQDLILSVAYDLCIRRGELQSSLFLQIATGACGMISLLFSCILVHLAVMNRVHENRRKRRQNYGFLI